LIPLPVLDGGHILFSLWELITRRPVHHKVVTFLWKLSAALLLSLFILLTYRDFVRIFSGPEPKPEEMPAIAPADTNAVTPP